MRELLTRLGLELDELERALLFDPTERVAVVATRLSGRAEEVVGLATMDRYAREPDLVVADEVEAPGTAGAMETALRAHRR